MKKKLLLRAALSILLTAVTFLLTGCPYVDNSSSGYVGFMKNKLKYGAVTEQFQAAVSFANTEWLDEILTAYPEYDINYYSDEEGRFGGYDYETLRRVISAFHLNVTYESRNNLLEYLLSKGLNPNIKFSNGHYALDWACADFNDRPYLVKTLLKYGADPNNANTAGFYEIDLGEKHKDMLYLPIYWGIYKPAYTNAEDLLASGAEVTYDILHDYYGVYNTYTNSEKTYQLAFKKYLETTDESQFSKAEEYAILGETDKLIEEMKNGKEFDDSTAVVIRDFICRFGTVEALEVWDEVYGERDIWIDRHYKYIPFYSMTSAASEGNYEIVKYMFDSGIIELPLEGPSYYIPLEQAALAGSYDICKLLLDNDCPIKEPFNRKVFVAAFNGQDIEVFRLIAKHLTDKGLLTEVDIYNALERMPVKWNSFTKAAIDCLMDECGMTLQFFPIVDVDFETVEYLFKKGKPLSVVDLPSAIISKDAKTVKLLLDMGADPNQHSYFKNLRLYGFYDYTEEMMMPYDEFMEWIKHNDIPTDELSLDLAIVFGNSEIVSLLIDYGVNVDDDWALYMAVKYSSKATFDVLYNAGAPLNYKDDDDKETLLDAAKEMGRDDIIKILKEAGVKAY